MTSRLGVLLRSAMKTPGVVAAALVDSHGCLIESASVTEGNLAISGATASVMLRQWTSVGIDLGMGALQSLTVEYPSGPTMITPLGLDATLLAIGNRSCRLGRARLEAGRAKEAMGEMEVSTASQPIDHLRDLAGTTEGDAPSAPLSLATGEIVLVGTHTFRLVTKLIAHLLQAKGVRSSRLRAYSPSSTIIDVVLEGGTTLAGIDRGGLEDFSIERTEERGGRLVMRARKALAFSSDSAGDPRLG